MLKVPVKTLVRLLPSLYMIFFSLLFVQAQGESERALEPGIVVTGALDADTPAQVYTFDGLIGQNVSLEATSDDGLALALLVTDAAGQPIAQAVDNTASGSVSIASVVLPLDNTYYVTVFPVASADSPTVGSFELVLTASSAPESPTQATATGVGTAQAVTTPEQTLQPTLGPTTAAATPPATAQAGPVEIIQPGLLLTTSGLQISLTWNSTANLDLEIRDPVGGSLFWNTPSVASGGTFGPNVNGLCDAATASGPTEDASWGPGAIPTGSYEILVYYQQLTDCPSSDQVTFTVSAMVDGTALTPIEGTLNPEQVYLSSFIVNTDGTFTQGVGGIYDVGALTFPTQDLLANQQPITVDSPVTGIVTSQQPYQTYSFTGETNDVVTILMDATSGSLDPQVYLLDPNGNIVAFNDDDEVANTTNAAIRDQILLVSGVYTIVATRYGQTIGGTEGNYNITLSGPTGNLPAEVLALDLPPGAIEISLLWSTGADLQLLARDSSGDAVFDDIPTIPSGGRLGASGNVNCQPTAVTPVSYIYWPEGVLRPGTYEVEVWYQNSCNDTRFVAANLYLLINNELVFQDTIQPTPDQIYLMNFTIDVNGQVSVGDSGIFGTRQRPEAASLDFQSQISNAVPIQDGDAVTGAITSDSKFQLYTFQGEAGDVVTINMTATVGTLDTTLFLIDPNGIQIAQNDDATRDTTDSLIDEFTLPETGQYIIIASHYGALYGATIGNYTLSFSRLN